MGNISLLEKQTERLVRLSEVLELRFSAEMTGNVDLIERFIALEKICRDYEVMFASLNNGARFVLERARELCPVSHFGSHGLPPGALRDSLKMSRRPPRPGEVTVLIQSAYGRLTSDHPYAHYVEYGTRYTAAQPFMRPAVEEMENRAELAVEEHFFNTGLTHARLDLRG